jgi:hypothetical protein
MSRCCPHGIAKRPRSMSLLREHSLECLFNVAGAPIGQSGNDGAAGKNLRVCCEHNRGHGAAGREAGHEYFAAVRADRTLRCRRRPGFSRRRGWGCGRPARTAAARHGARPARPERAEWAVNYRCFLLRCISQPEVTRSGVYRRSRALDTFDQ